MLLPDKNREMEPCSTPERLDSSTWVNPDALMSARICASEKTIAFMGDDSMEYFISSQPHCEELHTKSPRVNVPEKIMASLDDVRKMIANRWPDWFSSANRLAIDADVDQGSVSNFFRGSGLSAKNLCRLLTSLHLVVVEEERLASLERAAKSLECTPEKKIDDMSQNELSELFSAIIEKLSDGKFHAEVTSMNLASSRQDKKIELVIFSPEEPNHQKTNKENFTSRKAG